MVQLMLKGYMINNYVGRTHEGSNYCPTSQDLSFKRTSPSQVSGPSRWNVDSGGVCLHTPGSSGPSGPINIEDLSPCGKSVD